MREFSGALTALMAITIVVTSAEAKADAPEVIRQSGISGGLIVHLGCGAHSAGSGQPGRMTADLRLGEAFVVHGLDPDPANVRKARDYIRKQGLYGQVSIDRLYGDRLPYVDNIVRALVVSDRGSICRDELMRVVCPGGVAVIDGKAIVKPWPKEISHWPQHFNTPDNNAVAFDSVVGPPRYLRWVSGPEWMRSHLALPSINSLVSADGRLYTIEDSASVEYAALPGKYFLICRDAFNGIELWRHPFTDWHPTFNYVKYTPVQLQRQLAAIGGRVFCTPGLDAPITVFDAATGAVLKKFRGTEETQEFVYSDGTLYVVTGDPYDTLGLYPKVKKMAISPDVFGKAAYGKLIKKIPNPKSQIVAIDAESGQEIWKLEGDMTRNYEGATLAVRGSDLVYALKESLLCIDCKTGKQKWRVETDKGPWWSQDTRLRILGSRNRSDAKGPGQSIALVIGDKAVYMAACNLLLAFSLDNGDVIWKGLTHLNHYKSPDLFLVGDMLWTANRRAYNAITGEVVKDLDPGTIGPMPHDRCYRNRITSSYYINSQTGGSDFLPLDGSAPFPNHWVRSTCGIGFLPCNGMLYVGPNACSCYNTVQMTGFNALSAEPGLRSTSQPVPLKIEPVVEKGPAFGKIPKQNPGSRNAIWPTYRNTNNRGGSTGARVSAELKPAWQVRPGSGLSAPTIADGKVFVADVDEHTVYAIDSGKGEILWSFTAGSRVDSPPTWHDGSLLFGSHDGWVYCLRAEDGKLAWRFKALPDRTICVYRQPESVWPVCGSILVRENVAYFCAGRNSFIDGGMVLFALDPATGEVLHKRHLYGPFKEDGFQVRLSVKGFGGFAIQGNKGDVMLADDEHVYLRHQPFNPDLAPVDPKQNIKPHLIANPTFLESTPNHRSFWTINTKLLYDEVMFRSPTYGDILVQDGDRFYEVRGYVPRRNNSWDPARPNSPGYRLYAGMIASKSVAMYPKATKLWETGIPLTGKALALADDILFVAGTPVVFPKDDLSKAYDGRMGGVLWAASVKDGRKLAEYKLDAPPVWDSLAAVDGRLFICTQDGMLRCFRSAE